MTVKFYYIAILSISLLLSEENLKQARVTEYFATQTIDYIENVRENGDTKEYLFVLQTNAFLERAKSRLELGDYEAALEDVNKVVFRDPYKLESYYYRGQLLSILGKYSAAVKNFNVIVENNLFLPDVFAFRAEARFNLSLDETIILDIDHFLNLTDLTHPYAGKLFYYKGTLLFNKEKYFEALENLHISIELSPEMWDAYMIRGNIYRIQGQLLKAFLDLDIAVNSNSCPREVYLYRGLACATSGEFDRAIKDLNQFLQLTPSYHKSKLEAFLQRAIAKFYKDNFNEAIVDLNEVILRDPDHWLAFRLLGLAYQEKNDFKKALVNFNSAFEHGDHDIELYLNRGLAHIKLSHYKLAESDFSIFLNKVNDKHNEYGKVLSKRGISLFFMDRIEEACIDWNYSLLLNYDDANKFIQMHCLN